MVFLGMWLGKRTLRHHDRVFAPCEDRKRANVTKPLKDTLPLALFRDEAGSPPNRGLSLAFKEIPLAKTKNG